METWEDYVKMLGSNIELPETEPNAFETLMEVRENMTKRQQKLMDSKEKRLSSSFFLLLGATSIHFNSFRRAMDLVSTRSWDEQHRAQGLGTGESRRTAMGNRRALTLTFEQDYQNWLRREGSDVFMLILAHDDFMQLKKKFQFDVRDAGVKNLVTGAIAQKGKTYFQEMYAVGVVKILKDVPAVYENSQIPTKNPEFISVDDVVEFVRATLFLGFGDSCQGVLDRFLQGRLTGGIIPDINSIYDDKSYYERIENHLYRSNSDAAQTRNCIDMGLNHLQRGNSFKSFQEFYRSALAFLANPVIFEGCEKKRLYPVLGDFPAWDRLVVLLLQGDGTGRRTINHLADLLRASTTPDLEKKFQAFLTEDGAHSVPYVCVVGLG